MSSQEAYDLSGAYRSEVALGNISQANSIAVQATDLYEKEGDLKQAAIWRRVRFDTLFMQGRFDEAAAEAKTFARGLY